ncbi:hypothetical protein [Sutcliffiella halmapala]|uniref:hypothetical protein n=1 Tax=Sutcliffiella halmapala TaxID=79882 RepID=UPI0009950808|nr:hypothetical protein [Sutcliffiella halmapala]
MTNKDFRVQFPLWNIALCIILLIVTYSVVRFTDMLFNGFEGVFSNVGNNVIINWSMLPLLSLFAGIGLLIAFFIAYFMKLKQHNKENPRNRLNAFTSFRPNEILEDDEMLSQVTRNATKKVYVLYSSYLPMLVLLMFFPFDRYVFVCGIFLLLILQNALFYREIRQYLSGDYRFNKKTSDHEQEKSALHSNKILKRVFISATITILVIGVGRIVQMENHHEANMLKLEACMNSGATAVVEKNNLLSLSTLTCEKN